MTEKIDYTIYYRRWHSDTDKHFEAMAKEYDRWLSPFLKEIDTASKILDYGCGYGILINFMYRRFKNTIGIDSSEEQIAVGQRRGLPVYHIPVEQFPSWSEEKLNSYDVILLFDVLEHIPVNDQILFMRRISGMLKKGGHIFIKVPNANSLLGMRWRYNDWTHHCSFTECSLEFVCLNSGFTDINFLKDESSLSPRWHLIPRWGLRHYYLRQIFRSVWRCYLRSELGSQCDKISVGYNLFAHARKA